jgi:uncharacterized protein (TIGR02646 family)
MQYIKKSNNEPADWALWFTTASGRRTFDYKADYQGLPLLALAKAHLLAEQNHLCAYCQTKLTADTASIEHMVPKSLNTTLSTNYFNLVAVCKETAPDLETRRNYCEPARGNLLLPNLIFFANAEVTLEVNSAFFDAYSDGTIAAKPTLKDEIKSQVEAFIEILNLNHPRLKSARKEEALAAVLAIFNSLDARRKKDYLKNEFARIAQNPHLHYRQFLLIYIAKKMGIN